MLEGADVSVDDINPNELIDEDCDAKGGKSKKENVGINFKRTNVSSNSQVVKYGTNPMVFYQRENNFSNWKRP